MIRAKLCVLSFVLLADVCVSVYYNLQLEKVNLSAAQTLRAAFIKVKNSFVNLLMMNICLVITVPTPFTFLKHFRLSIDLYI